MKKLVFQIITLLALIQLVGCATSSPVADSTLVREAMAVQSDKNIAKLYIIRESNIMLGEGASLEVVVKVEDGEEAVAGLLAGGEYLYLKFDEGNYIIDFNGMALGSKVDMSEYKYSAKAGAVDMIVGEIGDFRADDLTHVPFDSEIADLEGQSLRQGKVSHFAPSEYYVYTQAKKKDTVHAFQSYLKKYPNSQFKRSAEKRIEELKRM